MKRKNSETTQAQNFAGLLQEIKSILPENFICTKMTELEQSTLGFASATTEDLIEIQEELKDFANLLALGGHHAVLENNIKQQIQAINEILPSADLHQSTRQRLEGAAEETEQPDESEEDEIVDSDAEANNTPSLNTQNSNSILPVHQDSTSDPITLTPPAEENHLSTQSLGDSTPN